MRKHRDHPGVTIRVRKSGSYQVRYWETTNGIRKRETFTSPTYAEAFKKAITVSARLGIAGSMSRIANDLIVRPGVFPLVIEEFHRDLKTECDPLSDNPKSKRYELLRCAKTFHWETTRDLTAKNLKNMVSYYVDKGMRPTAHKFLSTIRHFIHWCHEKYQVPDDALKVSMKKPPSSERSIWTIEQQRMLMNYLRNPPSADDQQLKNATKGSPAWREKIRRTLRRSTLRGLADVVYLELAWGIRPVELSRLTVSMFIPTELTLRLPAWLTKNKEERTIGPLDDESRAIIESRCAGKKPSENIFLTANGSQWRPHYQSSKLRRVIKELGLPGSLYSSRHTAITRIVNELGDLRAAMDISGHKTLSQIMQYIHKQNEGIVRYGQGIRNTILGDNPTRKTASKGDPHAKGAPITHISVRKPLKR